MAFPYPFTQSLSIKDALRRLHSVISRCFLKNRRILILKNKSIGPIKWQKTGLEYLLISPCLKRRIRERAIRDFLRGEHQKSSSSVQRFHLLIREYSRSPELMITNRKWEHKDHVAW
jgi:hypothetical protein